MSVNKEEEIEFYFFSKIVDLADMREQIQTSKNAILLHCGKCRIHS